MNKVIEILMKRDGMSYEDARSLVKETRDEIISCEDFCNDPDEIIADYLGLEPDYIDDILNVYK